MKKIITYTLLMKRAIESDAFFAYLMKTYWFKETVDLYFESRYDLKYDEIVNGFIKRGIVRLEDGMLFTTVQP